MERLLEVKAHLHNLSLLVMSPVRAEEAFDYVAGLCLEARTHFLKLADAHHVVIRALEPLEQAAVAAGAGEVAQFANAALGREHARIANGLRSEEPRLNSSHPSISYAVFCLKKKI